MLKRITIVIILLMILTFVFAPFALAAPNRGYRSTGEGSTYGEGDGFHGRRTANGERFNAWGAREVWVDDKPVLVYTAAHRGLSFGTILKVTNRRNGKWVLVRINDRGPFARGRIIDINAAAAKAIGMDGVAPVKIEVWSR